MAHAYTIEWSKYFGWFAQAEGVPTNKIVGLKEDKFSAAEN